MKRFRKLFARCAHLKTAGLVILAIALMSGSAFANNSNTMAACPTYPITSPSTWQAPGLLPDNPLCDDAYFQVLAAVCSISVPQLNCQTNIPFHRCCKDYRYNDAKLSGPPAKVYHATSAPSYVFSRPYYLLDVFNTLLKGPGPGLMGVMPNVTTQPNGMPHKDTLAMPLVTQYPWLYKSTYTNQVGVSAGGQYPLYRGTGNNAYADINLAVMGNSSTNIGQSGLSTDSDSTSYDPMVNLTLWTQTMQCKMLTNTCNGMHKDDGEVWTRLVLDSCANQYILTMALNPNFVFHDQYRFDGNPWNESYCQMMTTTPVPCMKDLIHDHSGKTCLRDNGEAADNTQDSVGGPNYNKRNMYDYRAWGFLELGFEQIFLQAYSPASGTNPNNLSSGNSTDKLNVQDGAPNDQGFTAWTGEAFGFDFSPFDYTHIGDAKNTTSTYYGNLTTINQLSRLPFERIFEPTHPYTPRWNTVTENGVAKTDRDYSALTKINLLKDDHDSMQSTDLGSYTPLTLPWPFHSPTKEVNSLTFGLNAVSKWCALVPIIGCSTPPGFKLSFATRGYHLIGSGCYVRCARMPVDILYFRYQEFNNCMSCRLLANVNCFWSEYFWNLWPFMYGGLGGMMNGQSQGSPLIEYNNIVLPMNMIQAFWYTVAGTSVTPPSGVKPCKTTLQAGTNQIYQLANTSPPLGSTLPRSPIAGDFGFNPAGLWPPCSTQFDTPIDNSPERCKLVSVDSSGRHNRGSNTTNTLKSPANPSGDFTFSGTTTCVDLANDYADNVTATDNTPPSGSGKRMSSVTKCCNDLAQALAPINTLKIRNLQDDPGLLDARGKYPEGYAFKDYFGDHLPYMRWWDTGTSAGGGSIPNISFCGFMYNGTNYNPFIDKGKDDIIVGAGTETAHTGSPAGICRYGGGGGRPLRNSDGSVCVNIGTTTSHVDRLTSWFELKAYQMNAMRNYGLNCLPQYEKMWKWAGGEDGPLYQAGKHFNTVVPLKNDPTHTLYQYKPNPWPLRWRGYLSDLRNNLGFPNFDQDSHNNLAGAISTGLDNARIGDIIFFNQNSDVAKAQAANSDPNDPYKYVDPANRGTLAKHTPTFPFMAVVVNAWHNSKKTSNLIGCTNPLDCTDKDATCSDFIEVVDVNNGRFPDACGNTDYVGMGQSRRIFKEWLPSRVQDALFQGTSNASQSDSCGDWHTAVAVIGASSVVQGAAGHCSDPKYSVCTFYDGDKNNNDWNKIMVYRPKLDERGH